MSSTGPQKVYSALVTGVHVYGGECFFFARVSKLGVFILHGFACEEYMPVRLADVLVTFQLRYKSCCASCRRRRWYPGSGFYFGTVVRVRPHCLWILCTRLLQIQRWVSLWLYRYFRSASLRNESHAPTHEITATVWYRCDFVLLVVKTTLIHTKHVRFR